VNIEPSKSKAILNIRFIEPPFCAAVAARYYKAFFPPDFVNLL
jgi:hypothetical protein